MRDVCIVRGMETKNMKELQQSRLDAYLDKVRWQQNGQPLTLRQRLANMAIIGKSKTVQEYSTQKRNLTYAKLAKPKVRYFIDYRVGAEDYDLEVPKMVWDWVIAVEI